MKLTISILFSLLICSNLSSQTLNIELEDIDPNITWPTNWDIVSDGERLITINSIGYLNIRENGVWQNILIDPSNNELEPSSIDVDSIGNIWIATNYGLWVHSANNEFVTYNTSNSTLPTDKLSKVDIYGDHIWISSDQGLIRYNMSSLESDLFNMDNNEQLKINSLSHFIDLEGNVWIDNRECLTIVTPDLTWTSEDFRDVVSGALINDIDFISEDVTIISAKGAIIRAENGSYEKIIDERLNSYSNFHLDNAGNQWIHYSTLATEFIAVRRNGEQYDFPRDSIESIPSQVYGMIEHQDTIMMVGLLGNRIAKCTFDFPSSSADVELNQIQLYPNPATENINIKGLQSQDYNYTIYNINGQKLLSSEINNNQVKVASLDSGTYILELWSNKSSQKYLEKFSIVR